HWRHQPADVADSTRRRLSRRQPFLPRAAAGRGGVMAAVRRDSRRRGHGRHGTLRGGGLAGDDHRRGATAMNVAPDLSGDLPRARDRTTRSWLGGLLEYHPVALASDLAEAWFRALRDNARWTRPKVRLFGREIDSPRLAAWYGDPGARYTYSGLANEPMPWIEPLPEARRLAERLAGASFNGVLLNFYRDGGDSMGW